MNQRETKNTAPPDYLRTDKPPIKNVIVDHRHILLLVPFS